MRLNAALASALVSSAALLGHVHAEETEKPAADATSTSVAEKPTFTVCAAACYPSFRLHTC